MRIKWIFILLFVPIFAFSAAKSKPVKMRGYIVDAACAKDMAGKDNTMQKAADHTKKCALEESCAPSGYGLFSDGKYYKFDAAGDKKAKELIEKTSKERAITAEVTGRKSGDTFVVKSIKEVK